MLDGPDGMALSLTPEAARQSAESIRAAAALASTQADTAPKKAPR